MAFNLTQIVGNKVEKKVIYDNDLRSTSTVFSIAEISKFSKIHFLVFNTLDQSVGISFYPFETNVAPLKYWDGETFIETLSSEAVIPANSYVSLAGHPIMEVADLYDQLRIRIKPKATPTVGNFKIIAFGQIN